jgi:hypothetical protein
MGNQTKRAAEVTVDETPVDETVAGVDAVEAPAVEVSEPAAAEVTVDETPVERAVVLPEGVEVRSNRDMIGKIMVDGVDVDLPKFNEVVPDHLRAIALAAGWGYETEAE